jgi:protein involved in polysaccharide export with SLBB domain
MIAANTAVEPKVPANYVIQPGDVLMIRFEFHPDHDQTVTVRSDGGITLPLAGEVKAAGLMPEQLADELVRLYSKNLRDPRISVGLKVTSLSRVYVGGEVNKPGFVFYRPGLTAVQAVVGAGGPRLAFARDYFSDSFTTEDNVRHQFGVPVLTAIPDSRKNRLDKAANGGNGPNGHGRYGH